MRTIVFTVVVRNLFVLATVLTSVCVAQSVPPADTAGRKLVLMCLSAHPDDEDGSALAYYGKLRGVKTYTIFFTRGEGGQNAKGPELYGDLGEIRTRETKEAAAVLGSEPHFLGFPDFGFSKTAKETFARWGGRDSVLAKLVYVIRVLKPDVIVTNHDTVTVGSRRQHGNHQAVGVTAYEAFSKAADKNYHSEQLKNDIETWQPKKLFVRFFQRDTTVDPGSVVSFDGTIPIAGGQSAEQIALEAIHKHRSQGLDNIPMNSFFSNHKYRLFLSDKAYPFDKTDFFSGITPARRAELSSLINDPPPVMTAMPPLKIPTSVILPARSVYVGLVNTYDNTLENLFKLGSVRFRTLDSAALATARLDSFSVVVLDLRTYEFRTDIVGLNQKILDYVQDGGNVVCFYHKTQDWNGKNFSPYPIFLTNDRVTEEDAAVTILLPNHPFFRTPNKILPSDWNGWMVERSIYLPSDDTSKTSPRYLRMLSMSDEDEHQPPTSLLTASYGQGTYTYVALALYRQLQESNSGGLKLLFNMLSQPRH